MNRLVTGVICGVRVEEIEDPLMQKIRWLDNWLMNWQKANLWIKYFERNNSKLASSVLVSHSKCRTGLRRKG